MISGWSIWVLVGQTLSAVRRGRVRRFASMKPGIDTVSAAIITTARLGSHAPKISRKAKTFVGWTIPEISRPVPNTNPHNNDAIIGMIQPPNT
jgi:hypothetical protein